jgi:hypothetical protein
LSFKNYYYFLFLKILDLTVLPRQAPNYWVQEIFLPQPLEELGLQVWVTLPAFVFFSLPLGKTLLIANQQLLYSLEISDTYFPTLPCLGQSWRVMLEGKTLTLTFLGGG